MLDSFNLLTDFKQIKTMIEENSKILSNIKEYFFLGFTLSLVASYFACFGYYKFFGLDITSYLSIEDLTMIFAKWIWLSGLFVLIITHSIYAYFKKIENSNGWWDRTIGRTLLKRRAIPIFLAVIGIIALAILSKPIRDVLVAIFGFGYFLFFIVAFASILISSLIGIKSLNKISFKEVVNLILVTSFFVFIVPVVSGAIAAGKLSHDKISVVFDDNTTIATSETTEIVFIGKTTNYFFLQNTKTKATLAYRLDKVKSIEVMPSKIKWNDLFN